MYFPKVVQSGQTTVSPSEVCNCHGAQGHRQQGPRSRCDILRAGRFDLFSLALQ